MKVNMQRFILPQYSWPGGYTILYANAQGDCFCARCASWERFKVELTRGPFWEGEPERCVECDASIESSYGPVEEV